MHEALVVVDLQTDFCPGGALAVPGGDAIVPLVNRLLEDAAVRVLTADWHPPGHRSFAAAHAGKRPFDRGFVGGVEQVLWPEHCVQGTDGAAFHPRLRADLADMILRKGFRPGLDSYSAFFENDRKTRVGLDALLREAGVREIVLAGLYSAPISFSFPPAFMREARLRIAAEWREPDLIAVRDMIAAGTLSLDGLITHRRDATAAPEAYRTAFGDPACLKMILDWRQTS